MSNPRLVPGHPELISVWFLGARRTISRVWYDKVTWLANCSEAALMKARAAARAGELCELDDAFWERKTT